MTAGDDFYIVDKPQYLTTYTNDNAGGSQMVVVTPAGHGGVHINNWDPFSCTRCPYFTPQANYTGFDFFSYQYVVCCGNPPGPPSNVATVNLLLIGNDDAQNAGACPTTQPGVPTAPTSVGQPINVTNGNMWLEQTDYALPGGGETIKINRFYNSIIQSSGLFGFGWSTKYDESIVIYDDKMIRLNQPDGRAAYFGRTNTANPFFSFSSDVVGEILQNPDNSYTLTFKDGRVHKFSSAGKLLWQKDRNGNQTTLAYDINGILTSITDTFGRTLTLTPGANGNILQISDSLGVVATYDYVPGTFLLQTVTYADGSKFKFEYDSTTAPGKILLKTVKDALDNILETHLYDQQGRATTSEKQGGVEKYTIEYTVTSNPSATLPGLTTVTDALGHVTKYHYWRWYGSNVIFKIEGVCSCGGGGSEETKYDYDWGNSWLNLVYKKDALNRETTYTYDSSRNLLQKKDHIGATTLGIEKFTYNSYGEVLTYKDRVDSQNPDPNANTITNTYDSNGNLLTSKDGLNNTTVFTYTALGQPATIKDARNNTTTLTWDTQGRLTQVKDANNKTTSYGYDTRARLTSTTNALTETTNFEFDLAGRIKKVIYPDTNFFTYTYDLVGRRTGMTDARNNTATYAYDNAYRLMSITDALNHTTTFGYDLMSNLTSQTDPLNNTTNYEYDDFNRVKRIVYPPSTSGATRLEENLTYDRLGNVKTRTDTAGRQTLYDYDTTNRLIKITDAANQITQFEYNARSQMTKVKDALNQEYTFTYDPLGRQLSQTRAGTTMSFEYDPVGNRTKRTDHSGRITHYEYDNLNRLKKIVYGDPVPAGHPPNLQATYAYDDLSRLTTAVNEAGTVSFTYDNRGRIRTTTDVFGHVIEYGY